MRKVHCGVDVHSPFEINNVLQSASESRFDFVCLPVFHPRFKREFTAKWKDRQGPFTRSDLVLSSGDWSSLIAGKVSPYINVDSEILCTQSKFTLEQELNYCNHLNVTAVIIPLRSFNMSNLARIVNSNFKSYQIWLEIPLVSEMQEASSWRSDLVTNQYESTWEWWYNFQSLCNYDGRLGIVLKVTKSLPDQNELKRWMGEPLRALVISTSTFLTNKKGYPVLSKPHQIFIKSVYLLDVQVIVRGNNHHFGLDCYQKYLDHLWREAIIQKGSDINNTGLDEPLGYPLAPLADNLMSHVYELFERDSVKYAEYMKALTCALLEGNFEGVINIMVVGAGRGPLVSVALQAAKKTDKKVKVFAVEKNPHAVVTLRSYQEEIWHDSVEVIHEDIRNLKFPQVIDILLSELLGSLGDNELSPELLDTAQNFLKEGGISIPESYTSYVCPVQGSKVYSDLKCNREKYDWENLFVTGHKNRYDISPSKPLFTFHHPNYSSDPVDNSRYRKLTFGAVDQNCVLHGFSGFFETTLYKDVKLSIVPETFTPGLLSWCPVFFPVMEPVYLKAGDTIEAHFWRLIGNKHVWYEWTVTKPVPLPVHNPNGRSSSIRLQ